MKRILALVLVLALTLSLCACGKGDNKPTDPNQSTQATTEATTALTDSTTEATNGSTEGTTEATQPTGEERVPTQEETTAPTEKPTAPVENTTAPTEAPTTKPTEAPTTKPTEAPATKPTECSHKWTEATCTAPKTCSACQATEGSAKGHSWTEATCAAPKTCSVCGATEGTAKEHKYTEGVCSVCNGLQENYKALNTGAWTANQVINGQLYNIKLSFKDLFFSAGYGANIHDASFSASFRDQLLQEYAQNPKALTVVDGVYYYVGAGDGGSVTYTVDGDSIAVVCDGWLNLSITRTAGDQLTITKANISGDPSGIVLTWTDAS